MRSTRLALASLLFSLAFPLAAQLRDQPCSRFDDPTPIKIRNLWVVGASQLPVSAKGAIVNEVRNHDYYRCGLTEELRERTRDELQQRGFFKAEVSEPEQVEFVQGRNEYVIDLKLRVFEGSKYHLGSITFTGNKAVANTSLLRNLVPMKDGDIFNVAKMREGLKNLREAYSERGYINFTPVPDSEVDEDKKVVNLKFELDEGKQYFIGHIEFEGNTSVPDEVMRRELGLEEGQIFNSRAWELSLERLNKLGFFEPLEASQHTEIRQNKQKAIMTSSYMSRKNRRTESGELLL